MIFVCYPKCSTCQKAKKWLDEHHISYELRDIKEENPGYEELAAWHQRSGLPLKRFFNTSGLLYKSMGLKDKLPGMSEEEKLQLLATDGMLVKRPLLVGGDFVLVGFKEASGRSSLGSCNGITIFPHDRRRGAPWEGLCCERRRWTLWKCCVTMGEHQEKGAGKC